MSFYWNLFQLSVSDELFLKTAQGAWDISSWEVQQARMYDDDIQLSAAVMLKHLQSLRYWIQISPQRVDAANIWDVSTRFVEMMRLEPHARWRALQA